jgi:proteasome lid subunit RPN8/RPN11
MRTMTAGDTVRVGRGVCEDILRLARAAAPGECCGMLIGRPAAGEDAAQIMAVLPAANLEFAGSRRRFRIAPSDMIDAAQAARGQGLELVGFFHSHPRGAAIPSDEDIAEASAWAGYYHIIAAPRDASQVRVYKTGAARWHEQQLL